MIFVNFRKAFLTLMFVLGAAALLLGYVGWPAISTSSAPVSNSEALNNPAVNSPSTAGANNELSSQAGRAAKENFFVDYRLDKEKSRSRQMEILNQIVDNPSSSADTRKAAQEQLMEISAGIAKEVKVENILRARGYKDAVVCVDKKGVTVIVSGPAISHSEEALLMDMVSKETGYGEQGIIILAKKN